MEDVEALQMFFDRMRSSDLNFTCTLDLEGDGQARSAFWVDSRSRAAYKYFGDVVTVDTACLADNYEWKLVLFVGVNHCGQPVLLGCGLLPSETKESFAWLFRTWLAAMADRPPFVIVSDQQDAIQEAVAEVFTQSLHRLCLQKIMNRASTEFSGLVQLEEIKRTLKAVVYDSSRACEFERGWNDMLARYALENNHWLEVLYNSREKWVPCFLMVGFWAGMCHTQTDWVASLFGDYVQRTTSLREFLEYYETALNARRSEEALAEFVNLKPQQSLDLDRAHWFEAQTVDVYTASIFKKFQQEVNGIARCYDMSSPLHADHSGASFLLKEGILGDNGKLLSKQYEVLYDKATNQVTCACNLFQFKGFLCRHSLYILQNHGVVEIPSQYIIPRWRKDYKKGRSLWYSCKIMTFGMHYAINGYKHVCQPISPTQGVAANHHAGAGACADAAWKRTRIGKQNKGPDEQLLEQIRHI